MRQLTIEINSSQDVQLFRELIKRLGFKLVKEKEVLVRPDINRHLEIIAAGIQRPESHLQKRLQELARTREDRIMPAR